MIKKLILLLTIIGILVCCRNEKKEIIEINSHAGTLTYKPKDQLDTLIYHYQSVVASIKNVVKVDDKDLTMATIKYPIFKNTALNKYIKESLTTYFSSQNIATESYQAMVDGFIKNNSYLAMDKDRLLPWDLTIDIHVRYQGKNYISLIYTFDNLSEMHPITFYFYHNYNTKTDQNIPLDSLIDPEKKDQLLYLAEKIFRKNKGLSATASLRKTDFFNDDTFLLAEDFYVNKKGLIFFYKPYENIQYDLVNSELIIPLNQLKGIAKPNTILTPTN